VSGLNLKDEWVEFTNKESSPVSLTEWKIEGEGSKHTYTFPSYTLDSGFTVVVYATDKAGMNLYIHFLIFMLVFRVGRMAVLLLLLLLLLGNK
jgi:hypothetical protein